MLSTFIKLPFVLKTFVLSVFEWPRQVSLHIAKMMFVKGKYNIIDCQYKYFCNEKPNFFDDRKCKKSMLWQLLPACGDYLIFGFVKSYNKIYQKLATGLFLKPL